MTSQQLKNSILQMAVQGKLVPQDPNDEPASVLLERIRAEKQELIKQGKIKKEKNPSYIFKGPDNNPYEKIGDNEPVCIADEVPFEIPETWEWVRLNELYAVLNGDRGKNYPSKDKLQLKGIPFISALNLKGNTVEENDNLLCLSEEQYNKLGNGKLLKNDIVVCIRGSLGKHGRYPFEKGAIASSLVILRGYIDNTNLSDYLLLYLDTPLFFSEVKKFDNGTAQPNLAAKSLEQFFIPLPPLGEQKRILKQIEKLLPYITEYEKAEKSLTALNKSFPDQLKKSILQQAVQGKLVPQDPNDEPASVLLERIRAEKQELIKAKKIKKDKNESVIFKRDNSHYELCNGVERCIDDEIPFEIPESWCWARCSSLGAIIRGSGIKRTETIETGAPCIRYGEIYTSYNRSFTNTVSFIPKELFDQCKHISKEDVVFTLTGENKPDIAKAIAYLGDEHIAAGGDLAFWTHHGMNPLYLVYFMSCPYTINRKVDLATGDIIVHISGEKIGSILIPVPPINEQNRIVEQIDNFTSIIAEL